MRNPDGQRAGGPLPLLYRSGALDASARSRPETSCSLWPLLDRRDAKYVPQAANLSGLKSYKQYESLLSTASTSALFESWNNDNKLKEGKKYPSAHLKSSHSFLTEREKMRLIYIFVMVNECVILCSAFVTSGTSYIICQML